MQVSERNRQVALEVDKIFTSRKQREKETAQLEEQIENYYRTIENRINELEPAKLRTYEDLHVKQKELNERAIASENKLNEINAKIERYESNEKGNSYRKEYSQLEKQLNNLSKGALLFSFLTFVYVFSLLTYNINKFSFINSFRCRCYLIARRTRNHQSRSKGSTCEIC